jgi:diaminohydroxyphosphoribosylaminopyrimidine deaminase/5-amino-6-(5-phosphoribosylamino)uracil reductase
LRLGQLLEELGRRQMTNVLVEGGSEVLGSLFDARAIDEVHVFIAPMLCGGGSAPGPIGGSGIERIAEAIGIDEFDVQRVGVDLYITGRVAKTNPKR